MHPAPVSTVGLPQPRGDPCGRSSTPSLDLLPRMPWRALLSVCAEGIAAASPPRSPGCLQALSLGQGNKTLLQMRANLSNLSWCCSSHREILLSWWIAESNKDARAHALRMRSPFPAERLCGLSAARRLSAAPDGIGNPALGLCMAKA